MARTKARPAVVSSPRKRRRAPAPRPLGEGEELGAVFDALPWPVMVLDATARVARANAATAETFGLAPIHLELEAFLRLAVHLRHPDGRVVTSADLPVRGALRGQAHRPVTLELLQGEGDPVTLEVSAAPLRSGRAIVGAVLTWTELRRGGAKRKEPSASGQSGIDARRCMEERTPQRLEAPFTFPDDSSGWYEAKAEPVPEGIFVVSQDITERKRTEEALRSTTQRLESLLENSPLAVIEWSSADYLIIRWSDEATRLFGWTAAETVGKRIDQLDWVYPDDAPLVEQVMADMLSGKRPRNVNRNRNVRKDGSVIHCEWYNSTLHERSGQFSVLSLVLDVTERHRAEASARAAHESFVDAVESVQDGFAALDREFRFTYANRRAAADVGREPKELIGRSIFELFPVLLGTEHEAAYRRVMARRVPEAIELRGAITRGLYRIGIYPAAGGISIVLTDVTERRKAEEALKASEATLRGILNAANESIWLFTVDGIALTANRTALARVGMSLEGVIGRSAVDFLPEELARSRLARVEEVARSGQPVEFEDCRAGMRFEHTFYPVAGEDGRVDRIAIFSRDVTARRKADEALRRYELLASHSRDIVLFMRRDDGRILEANAAAQDAYGYSRDELLSRSIHELRAPESKTPIEEQMAVADARGLLFETIHRRSDGTTFPVEVSARGATIDGVRTLVSLVRDVSERKQAEEALRQTQETLEAFFAASPGILNIDDEELRYLKTDSLTPSYFGLDRHSIVGKQVKELAPELIAEFGGMMREVLASGRPKLNVEVKSSVPSRPNEKTYWRASYFPVPLSGGKRGLGVMGVEITDLKRAEEALREANRQLAEADQRKNEFLAVLSHELRNPLAPIRNSAYILGRAEPRSEQARRALAVIDRQAAQLSRLVDDLLDVTRITRNIIQLQRQPVDLNELVRQTMEDQRSLFEKAGVHLELLPAPGRVLVEADPSRLAQVVGNLLQNAVKFTPRGGRTTVVLCADRSSKQAVLEFQDTGMGMTPELVSRLFQPFSQADSGLDRGQGGLGLGLALVRGLVELHGGEVSAHSSGLGGGAQFVVRLPLSTDEAGGTEARARPASSRPRRVLVIEDNVDAALSLQEALELSEHEVAVVHSGPEGIAKARDFRPDLVLCDIGLPGMDGYQVARAFRSDEGLRGSRLVALSGYALPEDLDRAQEAGFEGHLAKPPSLEKLEELLAGQPGYEGRITLEPTGDAS